jgi:hypothetical protein
LLLNQKPSLYVPNTKRKVLQFQSVAGILNQIFFQVSNKIQSKTEKKGKKKKIEKQKGAAG